MAQATADHIFSVEHTDTLGGEANYSWVNRCLIRVPDNASDRLIMRRAKAAMGLNGDRGRSSSHGDCLEFRPHNACTVLFIAWEREATESDTVEDGIVVESD